MKKIKTPEEVLDSNFYKPEETLEHYDTIITCMEDYANHFKAFMCAQKCSKQCFTCSEDEKCDLKNMKNT